MPASGVKDLVKSQDFQRACVASLLPGAGAVIAYGAFLADKEAIRWWKDLKKPDWAPKSVAVYTGMDLLTTLPIGYASYLAYKHGGGFEKTGTCVALGVYGVNIALATLSVPFMLKKKSTKLGMGMSLGIHITAGATVGLFYKINPKGMNHSKTKISVSISNRALLPKSSVHVVWLFVWFSNAPKAGLIVLPYALWSLFYVFLFASICESENDAAE